jgi:hypothetical protein
MTDVVVRTRTRTGAQASRTRQPQRSATRGRRSPSPESRTSTATATDLVPVSKPVGIPKALLITKRRPGRRGICGGHKVTAELLRKFVSASSSIGYVVTRFNDAGQRQYERAALVLFLFEKSVDSLIGPTVLQWARFFLARNAKPAAQDCRIKNEDAARHLQAARRTVVFAAQPARAARG